MSVGLRASSCVFYSSFLITSPVTTIVIAIIPCYSSNFFISPHMTLYLYTVLHRKCLRKQLIQFGHIYSLHVDYIDSDEESCCCHLTTGNECFINGLYWRGFGVNEGLLWDHANFMILALSSYLEGRLPVNSVGITSGSLCVSEYVIECVCVRVFVMVEEEGRAQPWWGDCDQVSCDGWK